MQRVFRRHDMLHCGQVYIVGGCGESGNALTLSSCTQYSTPSLTLTHSVVFAHRTPSPARTSSESSDASSHHEAGTSGRRAGKEAHKGGEEEGKTGAHTTTTTAGGVEGEGKGNAADKGTKQQTHQQQAADFEDVDLEQYKSAQDLEVVGLDRLKFALTARGLKCGGNLQQRAERLFCIKGVPPEKWPAAIKAKK